LQELATKNDLKTYFSQKHFEAGRADFSTRVRGAVLSSWRALTKFGEAMQKF
jgi:hypothetical protein